MASKDATTNKSKKRKQHYRANNKPVKKKGAYPLHPGVQGFFITCDGGRERQAAYEALNVIDTFYEELAHVNDSTVRSVGLANKHINKKITFSYSSSDDDDGNEDEEDKDEEEEEEEEEKEEEEEGDKEKGDRSDACKDSSFSDEKLTNEHNLDNEDHGKKTEENSSDSREGGEKHANEANEPPTKKQCLEPDASKDVVKDEVKGKSIDKLIEDELKELGDKSKRRFINLDSGCNGVVFVQMRKIGGDPSPTDIVQHMMTSAASTRKHMSRFILRVLPIEVACYASEEEIAKAIEPLVTRYFPAETESPQKFAVLYEARANTGIDRMKIINIVAKSVPGPHKVDLGNPDKTIVVEVVKTVCLIGVVEKYKDLAKYNLRQLTSPK